MGRVVKEFSRALGVVQRVLDKNDVKKAGEPWADQHRNHHLRHAKDHTLEAWGCDDPNTSDPETGEHPVAHAVARLLMYLELIERRKQNVERTLSHEE
jgi:creatinine amidohydrolase/Fe(II)-dependent formamide hydrolase-like protein